MAKDIYQALIDDHREAAQMMEKMDQTEPGDSRRQELARELASAIVAHNRAESEVFYDGLQGYKPTDPAIKDRHQEHETVNRMLQKLAGMNSDDSKWDETLQEIKQNVETHVEEEENDFFAKARQVLSDNQAREMAERFTQTKSEVDTGV